MHKRRSSRVAKTESTARRVLTKTGQEAKKTLGMLGPGERSLALRVVFLILLYILALVVPPEGHFNALLQVVDKAAGAS